MKRFLAVMLAAILLIPAAAAFADGYSATDQVTIPDQIHEALKRFTLPTYHEIPDVGLYLDNPINTASAQQGFVCGIYYGFHAADLCNIALYRADNCIPGLHDTSSLSRFTAPYNA